MLCCGNHLEVANGPQVTISDANSQSWFSALGQPANSQQTKFNKLCKACKSTDTTQMGLFRADTLSLRAWHFCPLMPLPHLPLPKFTQSHVLIFNIWLQTRDCAAWKWLLWQILIIAVVFDWKGKVCNKCNPQLGDQLVVRRRRDFWLFMELFVTVDVFTICWP